DWTSDEKVDEHGSLLLFLGRLLGRLLRRCPRLRLRGLVGGIRSRLGRRRRSAARSPALAAGLLSRRLLRRLGDRRAVLDLLDAGADDLLAGLEAGVDDVVPADELAEGDRAHPGDLLSALARLDDEDEGLSVQPIHRQRRNRDPVARRPD